MALRGPHARAGCRAFVFVLVVRYGNPGMRQHSKRLQARLRSELLEDCSCI